MKEAFMCTTQLGIGWYFKNVQPIPTARHMKKKKKKNLKN